MAYNSSHQSPALLNDEKHELGLFKVFDNKSGEYLVAFCGELGLGVLAGQYYVNYFLPNVHLTTEQADKIAITVRAALNGNLSYDYVAGDAGLAIRAYVAQYIIWNIVAGYRNSDILITTKERIQTALGSSAAQCLEEIVSEIKRYEDHVLPSFAGGIRESAKSCLCIWAGTGTYDKKTVPMLYTGDEVQKKY